MMMDILSGDMMYISTTPQTHYLYMNTLRVLLHYGMSGADRSNMR